MAPPLRFGGRRRPAQGDPRPVLVLVPEHDAYSPPERTRAATAGVAGRHRRGVPMADHFLAGAAGGVAATVTSWLPSAGWPPVRGRRCRPAASSRRRLAVEEALVHQVAAQRGHVGVEPAQDAVDLALGVAQADVELLGQAVEDDQLLGARWAGIWISRPARK